MDATRQGRDGGRTVRVPAGSITLEGDLDVPPKARGVVLFAHGSGSSRHSPRNRFVAGRLQEWGLATLLIDLLTRGEEAVDDRTARSRFDIGLLAERLVGATDWLGQDPDTRGLKVGYFGASTGAGPRWWRRPGARTSSGRSSPAAVGPTSRARPCPTSGRRRS